MSQAGIATITSSNLPGDIPIDFVTDSGTAIASAHILNVVGGGGATTSGLGNTITITAGATVATTYTANSGSAVPSLNNLNLFGASTVAGTNPVSTTASGSTVTLNVQKSQAIAVTDATKIGLSSFNSSEFSVDANGFVSLLGGTLAIDSIGTQTGTNPIVATGAGLVTINGAVVAAGTNPVRSDGTGANTMAIEVQISQAIAATDATKIGLSNFDSSSFAVDANGFVTASTTGILKTLTGNSGGAISPSSNNINTVGTGSITIAGAGSTLTTQLTGLTNHSVQVGAGTATLTQLAVGTNGQVLIGATAADPAFATLTSSDSSITFTTGANTLSLQVAGGTTVGKTITGNSGGAISPTAGNWNTLGTGSITIAGSGSTLTTQLTGLTANSVLYGLGTATVGLLASGTTGQVLQTNTGAAPTYSTATYPSTTTVSQILYSSATNVVSGLATANSASLVTNSTGVPVFSSTMTNGQVIIGSTGATPTAATLTAGAGVTITNAAGSITIASSTGGFTWSDTSGTVTASVENGYFITTTCTSTLPAAPTEGDTVKYIVDTTNLLTITGNTGQKIRLGTTLSAAAGTCVNTQRGDSITLVYRTTGTTWFAESSVGGWNIT